MSDLAHPDAPGGDGLRVVVRGTVQGVGMRPFVHRLARAEGLTGRVLNDDRGVIVEVFGPPAALRRFVERLRAEAPPAARLEAIAAEPLAGPGPGAFVVADSAAPAQAAPRVSIPPDRATCPACLAEVLDPADRRHRYPFTTCTDCGPRFTLALGVPYDRARTTMAPFPLCADCRREYEDPSDRRFHAEATACPACGPRLVLVAPDGTALAQGDPALVAAGRALAAGRILAVKGLGGFHLACDAGAPAVVTALRARKRRDEKPLAVMARDLAEAERLAHLGQAERALLEGPERPIVLLRRREGAPLAPEIAPGSPLVGLLLPYTPLHHLLLAEAGRPLVMTSGNLSEEPIAVDDAEARARLAGVADLLLGHDRAIASRADDSVARVVRGRPVLLRRSRGWVPRGVRVRRPFARPTLAAGALLKNTFCLGVGDAAHLGPHVGDLENLSTLEAFEKAVARLEAFLRTRPALLAHDLHPEYPSTRWALERARREGLPAVAVQHHHAHAAAAMAEHGLPGPVLALAWDGAGLGTDGAAWGGELLLATLEGFERLATFRPLPLAGGDRAVREPWRLALAALDDAFAGTGGAPALDALPLFAAVPAGDREVVRRMIAAGVNAPPAHGAGRAFDAVAALAFGRPHARFEGQLALALDGAVDPSAEGRYPYAIVEAGDGAPARLDLRPLYRATAADVAEGRPVGAIAARFHRALVAAAVELLRRAVARHGILPVVLTGGCFANAWLAEGIAAELEGELTVHLHAEVPPGDGGLALGQAVVADARSR